ncbi:type A2 lantipeptide [aff. Roholtiella sp. LEGE 12411]|uniref:type A2 lantipeptide n=1 Tax=aff. Roholtiella sp. LEGE 12411 TaxID=1828822 RepID=UPI00187FB76A|nr:type A2 lantipeptide [aff. Roholtiella sp. LEGE 12411]MBE9035723.1 type A2 lantipeptide [aff. Roholtiella sp. LEGE 12411]
MSTPNENQNPKQASDYLEINESGELVVTDPQLADLLQELSPEELERIAGGKNRRCNSTNQNCQG